MRVRDWVDELDEIDQDCVHQYEYLLGRYLKDNAEYVEIDSKVMEMILEFETREDFFECYPELLSYANPALIESLSGVIEGVKSREGSSEMLHLWGRLGISLDVTPSEMDILGGNDAHAARELLVKLIQSDRCQMDGNTYFPYKDELVRPDNPEDDLEFDLNSAPLHPAKEQSKAFTIIVIQVYAPTINAKKAEAEWFYEELQDL